MSLSVDCAPRSYIHHPEFKVNNLRTLKPEFIGADIDFLGHMLRSFDF